MTIHTLTGARHACSVRDVPLGEGRQALIDGVLVAIFNTADGWFAVDARCPHRNGPLSDGIVGERSVICPLHNRRYALDSGEPIGHECPAIRSFPVELHDDQVFVDTQPAAAPAVAA